EHADDRGAELAGCGRDAAHPVQFGADRRADRDLPDGRPDRGDRDPGVRQHGPELGQLCAGEVGHADRPGAAQLEVRDRLGSERGELLARVRRDLVGKAAERDRHEPVSPTGTPVRADSYTARTISSASRPAWPSTAGARPSSTAASRSAICAAWLATSIAAGSAAAPAAPAPGSASSPGSPAVACAPNARRTIRPSSTITVPSVPVISSRCGKPGCAAVLDKIVPTAPEPNLTIASAVSSTSTWCAWVAQTAVTSATGPMHQRSRST